MLWRTYDVMEGGVGDIFWRDAVVGVENPQLSRVLEWMFLVAQHVQQAAQCLCVWLSTYLGLGMRL